MCKQTTVNSRTAAAKKAWETRRSNTKKAEKSTKKSVEQPFAPRVVIYDIPKGAKRVTILPGYQQIKFS